MIGVRFVLCVSTGDSAKICFAYIHPASRSTRFYATQYALLPQR
ncbi:hypothetical protein HMPREF0860_1955 [Treponema socranskii subsp. socranskii VPI DR56BR1116 = ATCC 35536]|uniref:Uncharacterized protein n=1 Tax=Treponema socranskii subsp. socranskii VPI DR56BR1116 = ATCC 35536 TaxID=1125725 RepID=U1FN88_TRESO|nr:hypothetical protein HMPREF1325_1262 [Treponema socranskii subsp. socranskii VPI DR56BR1116 = ATCC 35536]ERK03779.1 hypothetical protein HMPREF0860_1955 [Treponema socranskii subsp. socranskii VPI DR56BR1116 = ATCC 35536]